MADYRLPIKPSAMKEIDAISAKRDRLRSVQRITALARKPRPSGCEKLACAAGVNRKRQGQYRVIYSSTMPDMR
ncbi:MAG: type II toxin-antitoxin system mRNA interferase toxin, RelE/StbE family [Trueperaceae bacterium]|nr:type II toxin-antitoxin system mRNA interferase toxin, RelE/StbE family [Trueperaceae bacterium]